jgi:ABC-type lipoprotein release transport system permease subunit
MFSILLQIICPKYNLKDSAIFLGTIALLTFGISSFLSVQILFSNFYDSLIDKILNIKEDTVVFCNPSKDSPSENKGEEISFEDEEDEAFFNGEEDKFASKTELSEHDVDAINKSISNLDYIVSQPVIRLPEFQIVNTSTNVPKPQKCMLIGIDIKCNQLSALKIFDQVDNQQIQLYSDASSKTIIPIFTTVKFFPGLNENEIVTVKFEQQEFKFRCIGFLEQDDLFAQSFIAMPLWAAKLLLHKSKYTYLAVRDVRGTSSIKLKKRISGVVDKKYIVSHWSEELKVVKSLLNSINFIISSIVMSLFVITFFFGIASFDLLVKRHKKHVALFLAMGLPPNKIKLALHTVALFMSAISCMLGFALSFGLLKIIPLTFLKKLLGKIYLTDFSYSISIGTVLIILLVTIFVTQMSAYFSSKKLNKIDPLEDLR